jgi:hypothetical protein
MNAIEEKVKRPVKHVAAIARRYPGVWTWVDKLRANRAKVPHPWPDWCYLPIGGAKGIVYALGGGNQDYVSENMEGAFVASLGSWRIAKDIYIYDETVFEELWQTPIEGKLPVDVLHRLPTWCAYVAFPKPRDVHGGQMYGFYVHMNHSGDGPVLMMVLDFGAVEHITTDSINLTPYVLELHEGDDLLKCLELMDAKVRAKHPAGRQFSERFLKSLGGQEACEEAIKPQSVKQVLEPLLSLTVYLCSTSAEIRMRDPLRGLRRKPYTKKTKRGVRTFVPEQPQVWEVAYRIGATLRAAAAAVTVTGHDSKGDGTHASPRPHIRKAHWHSFWTGPMAKVGKPEVAPRELTVKWIPPTPVAMGLDGEIVPTVHRVAR